ncbi:MAG TPA: hypothetical protein PLX22_04420 [Spirochaetota bacterium]|nr:hypothetical protein [Spirochaetota bacterium]HOT19173.1 hypothetical protein [Spirochaetota bacterium]HPD04701.1 hypothetical protein [Spirochaetota bacterium]HQG42980.1 hypothetical protein [Spirochaetota bacterium]
MKNFRAIVPFIIVLVALCCSKHGVRSGAMLCTMHNAHNFYSKADFARCMGIDENALEDYFIFSQSAKAFSDTASTESMLKSTVCDTIVDEVMLRIQTMFTNKQFARWHFTEMSLPVQFRTFIQQGSIPEMMVVGLVKKEDLSARAIIYYLPLEYKMDIIGREKENGKMPDW